MMNDEDGFTEVERPSTRQRLDRLRDVPERMRDLELELELLRGATRVHSWILGLLIPLVLLGGAILVAR